MTDPKDLQTALAIVKAWGAKGGKASNAKRSPERRREIGQLGAKARWANHVPKQKKDKGLGAEQPRNDNDK